ncbi:hypothetical protein MED01_004283 [Micromonospora sp. MED01]|uniref:hypothetical protein n=1 Tax=Micromonospora alfalfae TaxID=2911212 RepID=UPI001EE864E1|nr:hypothetical protein [Micromonospora alfalfae]MCG5460857.1 hypothetical protein [Micromonospora alfalfae]
MARAANMQALTADVRREWPGVVVYGIGDDAHKKSKSGHNEDDTPGSKPELEDSDSRPEHRAVDIMLGKAFIKADADALVARLLADPKARARLFYIIWNGYIWSRSNGWKKTKYTGSDQHRDHVHASGWAADDENTASWPAVAVTTMEVPDMTPEEHNWLATVHKNLTMLDGRNPIGQIYTRMSTGEDATDAKYVPETPTLKSLGKQLTALQTALTSLAGRDFTDEPAIVAGVLAGLDATAIAAAIPPTMAKQVADELGHRLGQARE